jgi:NAD(P)-dependent dehydrogenase (short-subunit alcohol dehydrogenase family)
MKRFNVDERAFIHSCLDTPRTGDSGTDLSLALEIAKAIVFLASDESSYTVGSELIIDGGMSNL